MIPRGLALGRLCELAGVDRASQSPEGLATTVAGVTHDSRRVSAGDLFVAISGEQHDGAVFAPDAIASGAGAVVSESTAPGRLHGAVDSSGRREGGPGAPRGVAPG